MTAMIDRDIMTSTEIHDAEQSEYISKLTERLLTIQQADTRLLDAQNAACRGDWRAVVNAVNDARHWIRFAYSDLDLDTLHHQHPCTACHGKPDHDSISEPPNPCPTCGL